MCHCLTVFGEAVLFHRQNEKPLLLRGLRCSGTEFTLSGLAIFGAGLNDPSRHCVSSPVLRGRAGYVGSSSALMTRATFRGMTLPIRKDVAERIAKGFRSLPCKSIRLQSRRGHRAGLRISLLESWRETNRFHRPAARMRRRASPCNHSRPSRTSCSRYSPRCSSR